MSYDIMTNSDANRVHYWDGYNSGKTDVGSYNRWQSNLFNLSWTGTPSYTALSGEDANGFNISSGNYLTHADAASMDPGSGSFSLCFRAVFPSSYSADAIVIHKGNNTSTSAGWLVYITSTGILVVRCGTGSGSARASAKITIPASGEHHVAMVIDRTAGIIKGYWDGSRTGWTAGGGGPANDSLASVGTIDTGNTLEVGTLAGASYFSSTIGAIRIYSDALTDQEVLDIANGPITATTPMRTLLGVGT